MRETNLYPPIKQYLEAQGYSVKSEVKGADVVAQRGSEEPIIVEMKLRLSLELILQACKRLSQAKHVYIAVPAKSGRAWTKRKREVRNLCKRIGLGFLTVDLSRDLVIPECDPGSPLPPRSSKKTSALLREFATREGDPNTGGQTGKPIVTAYRQDAMRVARALMDEPKSPMDIKKSLGIERAGAILSDDYYGWFFRVEKGVYSLTDKGMKIAKLENSLKNAVKMK